MVYSMRLRGKEVDCQRLPSRSGYGGHIRDGGLKMAGSCWMQGDWTGSGGGKVLFKRSCSLR